MRRIVILVAVAMVAAVVAGAVRTVPAVVSTAGPAQTLAGPNVYVFNPTMAESRIQATVDSIAAQQVSNQFGPQRYALLFEPGVYGSASQPLNFQVGYYTEVAGLGPSPGDVIIKGSIDVYNQCSYRASCVALDNFWRSMSNLTIDVTNPTSGCYAGEFWAVSQAAPMRRVIVNGLTTLMDYCTAPSFASGGFIADSAFSGSKVVNGSQQQFVVRNSNLDTWSNGVWNQVFSGDVGAPAQCFPPQASCGGPYTTLASSPITEERPFLYTDHTGAFNVFVPSVQANSVGPSWASGATPGTSLPIKSFFVAHPDTPVASIDGALEHGKNLILMPGIYHLNRTISVGHADTVVLGLGFPTLVPEKGIVSMRVAGVPGVKVAGVIFDAGPVNSPALLQVGGCGNQAAPDLPEVVSKCTSGVPSDPTLVQDVFFRIGGATPGKATNSLVVNSSHVILDDIWAWRADHGNVGTVGWTINVADTGLIVNGDDVTAYGLFVEHYQKDEVIWNGQGGTDIFFQNEMPYDPPDRAAWTAGRGIEGYPAFLVSSNVKSFQGYGMGSYSFFNRGVDIYAAEAFKVAGVLPPASLHDLLTIFLNASTGKGGIRNVVGSTGGSSTTANPDVLVTVMSYP